MSKKNQHLVSMTNFKKHVTLTSSAMDARVVEFWKQRAVWWIHSTVLTCHLQACILVDWPSVVKWGVMSGRYLYMASRSSLMWIYNTNRHFRTSKILEHMHRLYHMQYFFRNLNNDIQNYAPWSCSSLPLPSINTQIHTSLCIASSRHIQDLLKTTCHSMKVEPKKLKKRILLN